MNAAEHTYKYQDTIQKLPIPELEDTCRRYLEVLEPLQSEKEHKRTQDAVTEFLESPISKRLQAQLHAYAEHRASYIEEFWYDSYLNYDSPVVLNLNPFFLIEDDPNPVRPTQVKRAAAITVSALRFVRALRRNELPPDKVRGRPLDMHQYSKLFASARVPTPTGCVMQSDALSRHVVVMSRSQFYWFNVMDEANDLVITEAGLAENFRDIVEDSHRTSLAEVARSSFGLLTTENRRVWANVRMQMSDACNALQEANGKILQIIDTALFIVCLDDVELQDLDALAVNLLCGTSHIEKGVQVGTCTNRWYDKLQIIVTRNAKVGVNFEHTGVDGHTVLRFVSDIYTDSILRFAKSINLNAPLIWLSQSPAPAPAPRGSRVRPEKLEWLLTPNLSLALRFAETRLSDLIAQTEFAVLEFKGYGLEQIKRYGCSPDAFVQMSFQAAYYALYGKVECTYEPAMTKFFLHGRTEAIRPVTAESNLFVRRFFEEISAGDKMALLQAACKKHSQRTKDAASGYGVDRHLYALFCIWQKYSAADDSEAEAADSSDTDSNVTRVPETCTPERLPAIFADPGWDKLNTSILSTSNCGNPALRLFGFGPTASNGFGLSYIIKADSLTIAASSKHRQTKRFLNTLNSYFVEIHNLYTEIHQIPQKPRISPEAPSRFQTLNSSFKIDSKSPPKSSAALNYLLGGYGYFDVGEDEMKSRGTSPEPSARNKENLSSKSHDNLKKLMPLFSSREIERKLRLAEY